MIYLNEQKNRFEIGGIAAQDIVTNYGQPVYVYDSAIMEKQYKRLKSAFKQVPIHINYACKALNNINVLRLFKSFGAGLDTVSIEEVKLGLHAGFEAQEILFTPNCVSMSEMMEACALGVKINIDNISILEQFGHQYADTIPVCIRINPHVLAGGNINISTGHIDSKFGISIHQLRHVERIVKSTGIRISGLHMHTGSDILNIDSFLQAADILLETAMQFPNLSFIDFGSGFKVPYKPEDYETDIEELGIRLGERFAQFCQEYGRTLELHFEPGKYLVSQAGTFLVNVNVLKQTTATVFVGVNAGLNHLIRPMLYNSYHHIYNISNTSGPERIYTIVGYICETDTFAWDRKLREVKEGDILAFQNAGAYGFTMASNYNSRLRPAEVLVHKGEAHLIREAERLEDLLRLQKEINLG